MKKRMGWKFQEKNIVSDELDEDIIEQPQLVEYKDLGYLEVLNNKIYLYADINREQMLSFIKVLHDKEEEFLIRKIRLDLDVDIPLHIHIQSYGGFAHSGFAVYDHIVNLKIPVYTYIDGIAASAATLLSIAGTKRFIHRNSFILIHQARYEYWGSFTHDELKDQHKNSETLMKALKKIYLERTTIDEKLLDELLEHDLYLPAEDALKYGFVDEIIG